jgi:integrase/recombinase XerD
MPKVPLMLSVKLDGKWRFLRASIARNGRVEPCVAIFRDRRRTFDNCDCGGYSIRFTNPSGKQTYEPVGKDPAVARARQIAKQAELASRKAGVVVNVEEPTKQETTLLADSITQYNNFTKENKARATWKAYKNALAFFTKFCDRHSIHSLEQLKGRKELILKFPKFVKEHAIRRTGDGSDAAFNNFAYLMTFLKWARIETGIRKNEWPEQPERDPEEYTDTELRAMLKAADSEERLVLKSFLFTGFRSGEVAHLTYERIDFNACIWKVRKNDEWGWKPKKRKSVRDIPVHRVLTRKIAERMKARNAKKTDLIFPNRKGKPDMHLLRIVKRVAVRAGLKDIRVDDHKFRSTAITRWLRAGYTVPEVVQMAGHADMGTIMKYAAKINVGKKEHRAKADKVAAKFVHVGD